MTWTEAGIAELIDAERTYPTLPTAVDAFRRENPKVDTGSVPVHRSEVTW
jgi:hypothetical protein